MARAESAVHLQPATSNPLGESALRAALGQLGNNSLALTHLDLSRLNLTQGKPSQPDLSIDLITRFTDHEPSFCMQCCTLCNAFNLPGRTIQKPLMREWLLESAPAGLFIPLSELKALRRSAANRCLGALRQRPSSQGLQQAAVLPGMLRHLDNDGEEDVSLSSRSPSAGVSGSSRQLALRAVPQHARTDSPQQEVVSRSASCSSKPQQQPQQQQALLRVLCRSMAQVKSFCRVKICWQHLYVCSRSSSQCLCLNANQACTSTIHCSTDLVQHNCGSQASSHARMLGGCRSIRRRAEIP